MNIQKQKTIIITDDNLECSCLGTPKHRKSSEFLREPIKVSAYRSPNKDNLKQLYQKSLPTKNHFKKSLRRKTVPSFILNNSGNKKNQILSVQNRLKNSENLRSIMSSLSPQSSFYKMSQRQKHQISNNNITAFSQILSNSNQHITDNKKWHNIQSRPTSSASPIYTISRPIHIPTPVKINFSISQRENPQSAVLKNKKNEDESQCQKNKGKHFSSLRTIKKAIDFPVLFKSQDLGVSSQPIKNDLSSSSKFSISSSIQINIQQVQDNLKFDNSDIPTQNNQGNLKVPEGFIQAVPSLKRKMDDVLEIYSQADQEDGDSDKESIVLGRLHQFSSVVEHKPESASLIERNIQAKLINIQSLSSSLGNGQRKRSQQ